MNRVVEAIVSLMKENAKCNKRLSTRKCRVKDLISQPAASSSNSFLQGCRGDWEMMGTSTRDDALTTRSTLRKVAPPGDARVVAPHVTVFGVTLCLLTGCGSLRSTR